jgi:Uma2 family endonuclease
MPASGKKLFTVDELLRMEEAGLFQDQRVELLHGEIFLMAPGSRHQARVDRLTAIVTSVIGSRAITRVQGPVLIDKFNLPEPDLMLIKSRSDFYEHAHPTPQDVLLLVEIADSSMERDREVKLALYAIAGIQEYWIENVAENLLLVYRDPAGDHYQSSFTLNRKETVTPLAFPDVHFSVEQILG